MPNFVYPKGQTAFSWKSFFVETPPVRKTFGIRMVNS